MMTYTTGFLCPDCLQLTADQDLEQCVNCLENHVGRDEPVGSERWGER